MLSESDFQEKATEAIEDLENRLLPVADAEGFEVEAGGGMLTLIFEEPPAKFIVSPNGPARQIWVSALATSFKFDWNETDQTFVLDKTREPFLLIMSNLLRKQIEKEVSL
jgi:CyaY protein